MLDHFDQLPDCELIELCLAGNARAAAALIARHERSVVFCIRKLLHEEGFDTHLVEDMSQEVWLAMIDDNYNRLARYQPSRGAALNTYLGAIAAQIVRLRHRHQGKRQAEVPLEDHDKPDPAGDNALVQAEFIEYQESLTPKEYWFVSEQLMKNPADWSHDFSLSSANARQLKHRAQMKWDDYLGNC